MKIAMLIFLSIVKVVTIAVLTLLIYLQSNDNSSVNYFNVCKKYDSIVNYFKLLR